MVCLLKLLDEDAILTTFFQNSNEISFVDIQTL